jgi:hypothetical protein
MSLVFQYGSNCLESEINSDERLRGDAKFVDVAQTVDDYQLAFDVQARNRGCAASDIVSTPGSKVWGVLYEVPDYLIRRETAKPFGRKSLDAIEGEGTNYQRGTIQVRRPNGQGETALTYTVIKPQSGLTTSTDYVRCIVAGLRQHNIHNLDAAYIPTVKKIAAANNPAIAAEVENL